MREPRETQPIQKICLDECLEWNDLFDSSATQTIPWHERGFINFIDVQSTIQIARKLVDRGRQISQRDFELSIREVESGC